MPREVRDPEGTAWSCVQAFAGLSSSPEKAEAARVEGYGRPVPRRLHPRRRRAIRAARAVGWLGSLPVGRGAAARDRAGAGGELIRSPPTASHAATHRPPCSVRGC